MGCSSSRFATTPLQECSTTRYGATDKKNPSSDLDVDKAGADDTTSNEDVSTGTEESGQRHVEDDDVVRPADVEINSDAS